MYLSFEAFDEFKLVTINSKMYITKKLEFKVWLNGQTISDMQSKS